MWLLWFDPLPAFRKENIPAMSQTRFVHGDRVGAGKDSTRFAVFALAVAEKERIVSREKMGGGGRLVR